MDTSALLNNIFVFLTLLAYSHLIHGGAVQLTLENLDKTVAGAELVFINFYADWCHYSRMLAPVWDETADLVVKKYGASRVLLGKIDCEEEETLSARFHIGKYPTLKLMRGGRPSKGEYRGQRSKEALMEYIEGELRDPVKFITSTNDIKQEKKGQVIGYFEGGRDSPQYQAFVKMATTVKEECNFLAGFGEPFRHLRPSGRDTVVVRKAGATGGDFTYPGEDLLDVQKLTTWTRMACVTLVREITFANAEELTEEGLPFMILFHQPEDKETPERYRKLVEDTLFAEKEGVNFLTADGDQFAHPLHHLGKTSKDLPLLAIDSFRHMYVFPDIKELETPGRLKQFIDDLHSGKLHREFHYGPDKTTSTTTTTTPPPPPSDGSQPTPTTTTTPTPAEQTTTRPPTSPPESVFKKLAPSERRYSILKDEL